MAKFLVSGLINLETTLQVDSFPVTYFPVRYPFFGVRSTISGVGYNISKALTMLGNQVDFLSLVGSDLAGEMALRTLQQDGIPNTHILSAVDETAQSVILYNASGSRQIHVDLKTIQESLYPPAQASRPLQTCDLAVLCNINFSRPFLQAAQLAGKRIASDVHALSEIEDPYNRDFMSAANILFMSHERLPDSPERWAERIVKRYNTEILVIGLGAEGALLCVKNDDCMARIPAVQTRIIANTIGAGDALFSCFLHYYQKTGDAYLALHHAMWFASYKIGGKGAGDGFLTEGELERLIQDHSR